LRSMPAKQAWQKSRYMT